MNADMNGIRMYYDVHGQGDPILLIHGFPLSGRMWTPVIEALKKCGRLIVPDLRGHGRTPATPDASMAAYADDLAALLDVVAPATPVVIVGFSMGGYAAFDFFRRYRKYVRAMVLVDTRAGADAPEGAQGRRTMADKVLKEGSGVIADAMIGKLFAAETAAGIRDDWHKQMAAAPPAGVAAALRAMADRVDSTPTLATIDVPTLIVVGDKDVITPTAESEKMRDAVRGSRLEIIPGAGHMSPVEKPELFTRAVVPFLQSVPRPSPG